MTTPPPMSADLTAIATAVTAQTQVLVDMVSKQKTETRHSTIQVKPQVKNPILGDDGPDSREIKEFFEKVEDIAQLANDGKGMLPKERLIFLEQCLRGAKAKTKDVLVRRHRKRGTYESDPELVYQELKSKLMKFS